MINESPELPRRVIGSLDYHPKKYSLFLAVESNQLVKEPILYSGFNSNYKNLILFMGKNGKQTLKDAFKEWKFEYKEKMSLTSDDSFLIKIKNIKKKN